MLRLAVIGTPQALNDWAWWVMSNRSVHSPGGSGSISVSTVTVSPVATFSGIGVVGAMWYTRSSSSSKTW